MNATVKFKLKHSKMQLLKFCQIYQKMSGKKISKYHFDEILLRNELFRMSVDECDCQI